MITYGFKCAPGWADFIQVPHYPFIYHTKYRRLPLNKRRE